MNNPPYLWHRDKQREAADVPFPNHLKTTLKLIMRTNTQKDFITAHFISRAHFKRSLSFFKRIFLKFVTVA